MASQFKHIIHLLSTDRHFRQDVLNNYQTALSDFELSEEERIILLDLRQFFSQADANIGGPNGPWGWQFISPKHEMHSV